MQVPTYPPQIALIELEHTPGGPAQSLAKMGVRTLLQRELPDASLQAAGHIEKRKHERKGSAGNDDIARVLGSARFPHQVPRQHRCCGQSNDAMRPRLTDGGKDFEQWDNCCKRRVSASVRDFGHHFAAKDAIAQASWRRLLPPSVLIGAKDHAVASPELEGDDGLAG